MSVDCQFCKRRVLNVRPDGAMEALSVIVMYQDKPYHVGCYDKLREIAGRTRGVL